MDLLADFLHFGTSVFLVARRFRAVWSVGRKECSVKCEVLRKQWEVRSVKSGVWSVKCGVWSLSLECEERSVKCEVWSVKEAVRSEKCGVWSVKCGVWSLKFGVRRVQCAVWGVECRGKDTVGTGCLWTIGHLFLGNFRRRLARVYVIPYTYIQLYTYIHYTPTYADLLQTASPPQLRKSSRQFGCFGSGPLWTAQRERSYRFFSIPWGYVKISLFTWHYITKAS